MNYIKLLRSGIYLPEIKVGNRELEDKLKLENGYIEKRTGIKERFFSKTESIEELAINAVRNLFEKDETLKKDINLIITATTSTKSLMPGISNEIQNKLEIPNCICLDILAGCSGYINAFDIAKLYIESGRIKKALIIGVEKLSNYIDEKDIGTSIILSDGAGATLIEATSEYKKYNCYIEADSRNNQILTCRTNEKLQMNGKEIYKYAVTKTVENVLELLKESNESLESIKYIIPHQSNMKIMRAISSRLKIDFNKVYTNISNIGNTFCASIPIALNEMLEKELIKKGDKIILLGYGGGLNTGSILIEV